MTDIIECENELIKWKAKNKLDVYYPNITSLLSNFSSKQDFLNACTNLNSDSTRREWYNLFGYPQTIPVDEVSDEIKTNWCRIHGYPINIISKINNPQLFNECCVYHQVASMSVENIKSNTGLGTKYLNPNTSDQDLALLRTKLSAAELNSLDFIKLHKKSSDFNITDKSIHYSDSNIPDNIIAWKRLRSLVKMFLSSTALSASEMLLNVVPSMKFIQDNVFSNVTGDVQALTEMKKLIALLPYKQEENKEFLVNYIDTFMEQKDIVKMLPQFKDKWINGRLVFEIGDDDKDLFKCYKGVMNTKYFVITVNPVDMLFCSTDQEYHSCFALDSPHGSNKGLINFLARPDTCMCFLSSGSLSKPWKSDMYKGLSFNHIKIKARAFIYNSKNLDMADVGRCYAPNEIANAGRSDRFLLSFRTDARLFLWKLLQESGIQFDISTFVPTSSLRRCIANPTREFNEDICFTFETAGLKERKFKGHDHNEVYMDNLSFSRDDSQDMEKHGTYHSHIGNGCCSRFNARSGNLGDLYTDELNKLLNK